MMERVNSSMIYFMHCKNFCNCPSILLTSTTVILLLLIIIIKQSMGREEPGDSQTISDECGGTWVVLGPGENCLNCP
jgi:hypothetical protein